MIGKQSDLFQAIDAAVKMGLGPHELQAALEAESDAFTCEAADEHGPHTSEA